ncbi:FKBP-type peptidyl-prolyl cis-trans isomerase [Methanosalsum natronophilum]|uniref:Peptidyl-prolyl cis-trans isomerase n=1 Tax=Methanosalsum natronophilum TaxID=768733 RepID=A0A3R7XVZ7_9EURY|nr:peptidylprolyl isomerase [Methanosalsum natronophilum]MCS3924487.1 FKBP-type peptidyl-prolyl cis-trans isomerase 2 [Methanosalsum natronophilum]RQD92379.1 MAG: peptidylprolyl isomerase [Methanosalsum natronophilum]
MSVNNGDTIKIDYEVKLEDGTTFDSTDMHDSEFEFEVGSGQIIEGFENEIIGMEVGEEKEFQLQPENAYGEPKEEMVRSIPRDQVPEDSDNQLQTGMMLAVALPNGTQIPAQVLEITEDTVTLDMNHPLAGQILNFKVKVNEIGTKED